jgi:tripartite-type tricarboxylate transporter receptor subunit TctC
MNRLLAAIGLALLTTAAAAQPYPAKPVKIIVPFSVGGSGDIFARMIAQKLAEQTGQSFVVENRTGAGGRIGYNAVAKAQPDGYTLSAIDSTYTLYPGLFGRTLEWDAENDLIPVTVSVRTPLVLTVNANTRHESLASLMKAAKDNPGKLNYGTPGNGTLHHIATVLLMNTTGTQMEHIAYKGVGDSMVAVQAGQVDVILAALPTVMGQIAGGKIKVLATGSEKRSAAMPNVPTFIESGIPFTVSNWFGLAAPKGTPQESVNLLQKEVAQALQLPAVKDRLKAMGAEPLGSTPEEFGRALRDETASWTRVIRSGGIKAD